MPCHTFSNYYGLNLMKQANMQYLIGVIASIVVVLIWSGWVILSRAGVVGGFSVWDLGFMRFGTATVFVLPVLFWRRSSLLAIFAPKILLPAFLGGSAYALLSFAALKQSSATNAGVIVNGLIPIATICLLYIFSFHRPSYTELAISILIIFANFLILGGELITFYAYLMFFVATFSLAFYLVVVPIWKLDSKDFFCAVPIVNAIFVVPCWLLFDGNIEADLQDVVLQVVYQGVLVTIIAVTLLTFAIHKIGTLMVSVVMSGVPATTAFLAYTILGETITRSHLMALVLCSVGIFLYAFLNRPQD